MAVAALITVLVGLDMGFDVRLPWWAPFPIYAVLYAAAIAVVPPARRSAEEASTHVPPDWSSWPTSGPIGRLGQRGLLIAFQLSGMLALLNPWQLVEIVRQGVGNARIRARIRDREPRPDDPPLGVAYSLPFRAAPQGEWFVYNGGVDPVHSHSWEVLTQRYAYDFVVVDEELRRHRGRGTKPDEYYCHGLEIVAAADGAVVEVEDRIRTAPLLGWGVADVTAKSFRGNRVVVRHAPDEFALYAHLEPGSVRVRPGEAVVRGQVLGRCGHTGHSSEPHLHFHLQDGPDFFEAAGLPVKFHRLVVDGARMDEGWIRSGQRVRPLAPTDD